MAQAFPIPDEFVSGLQHVEIIGRGNVRLVLVSTKLTGGAELLLPVKHIVMPVDMLPDAVAKEMAFLTSLTLKQFSRGAHLH